MRYMALATDYDGTIAHDGVVDEATVAALARLKESGRKVILVTGRVLPELLDIFRPLDVFDRVVAENGAILYDPATESSRTLSPPPPPELVETLTCQGVPLSVGRSIVATVEPYEHQLLTAIKNLGLEWHVIFNKGSVMALPSSVNKASGLTPALEELGLSADQTVGVGDAENDQSFLQMCGLAVAVANALPSLKEKADVVTAGARGTGVQELIDAIINDTLPKRAT